MSDNGNRVTTCIWCGTEVVRDFTAVMCQQCKTYEICVSCLKEHEICPMCDCANDTVGGHEDGAQ